MDAMNKNFLLKIICGMKMKGFLHFKRLYNQKIFIRWNYSTVIYKTMYMYRDRFIMIPINELDFTIYNILNIFYQYYK